MEGKQPPSHGEGGVEHQAPWWPAPVATGPQAHFVGGDPTRSPPSASLSPGPGMHAVPWRDGHLLLQGIHMVEVRGDK